MTEIFKELSETELEIMEYLWREETCHGIKSKEILEHFISRGKSWKLNTLNTFLKRLELKGLIATETRGKTKIYYNKITCQEYEHRKAKYLLDSQFDSSIKKFIVALNGGNSLDDSEADEIEKWFKNLE